MLLTLVVVGFCLAGPGGAFWGLVLWGVIQIVLWSIIAHQDS